MAGAVLLWAGACAPACRGESAAPLPPPADLLPRTAITSSDNAFEVSAPRTALGYRGPVLFFVDGFRKEFLRATGLELGRADHPIVIRLGSSTNDVRVIGFFSPGVGGGERETIEIQDPEHADLDALRTVLAQALVREWRRALPAARGGEHGPSRELPAWLLAGVARHAGGGNRLVDFDSVYAQWRQGRLPPVADLLSADPPAVLQYPAMQAVVAAWLLDRPGEVFAALLRRTHGGAPWNGALVAEVLRATKDPAALAEDWDAWQVNTLREVRQPGVTTPAMVAAFRLQLQIFPGDCGLPFQDAWRGRPLAECLSWPATSGVQAALRGKAMQIRIAAAGRDGALQRVAASYAAAIEAAAQGEAQETVRTMLARADEDRKQLEARAAAGEVLRDPVRRPVDERKSR